MSEDRIRQIIKPAVLAAKAYHVPDAKGFIKLDAMENPYTWSADLKDEWLALLKQAELNRYPDANTKELNETIANLFSVPESLNMMFGNGSDELIQIILMALNESSKVVMAPEPTFVMYRFLSSMLDLEFVGVPLNQDFSLDLEATLETIRQKQPAVIFIAWPNNPTGNAYDKAELEEIIKTSTGLVIIDEAYHVFAEQSMLNDIEKYPNVLLMRTLSKLGLAGLRLGVLIGASQWVNEFEKIRLPYNIGTLNQLSINFICQHIDVLYQQAEQIRKDRETLFHALESIKGIEVWPSKANFILFRVNNADQVHTELKNKKILIKNLNGAHPLLENCLRVTVGTKEENDSFISSLKSIL